MIVPPGTSCPPKALNPSRCAFESRPFREVPCPFLCAIKSVPSGQLPVISIFADQKINCHPERSEGPATSFSSSPQPSYPPASSRPPSSRPSPPAPQPPPLP